MTTDLTPSWFTEPGDLIAAARLAIARVEGHLAAVVGPLDPTTDRTSIALAAMSLESVHPPYPPLPLDVPASLDPEAELQAAIAALRQASTEATSAQEILRLAYVIRDLREVEHSPYLALRPASATATATDTATDAGGGQP